MAVLRPRRARLAVLRPRHARAPPGRALEVGPRAGAFGAPTGSGEGGGRERDAASRAAQRSRPGVQAASVAIAGPCDHGALIARARRRASPGAPPPSARAQARPTTARCPCSRPSRRRTDWRRTRTPPGRRPASAPLRCGVRSLMPRQSGSPAATSLTGGTRLPRRRRSRRSGTSRGCRPPSNRASPRCKSSPNSSPPSAPSASETCTCP
mmetsp:Transcript_7352/g.20924  ORF Transcript_7352/g.20924 Transcript_7352/m.20924 type:complete len:210 (-) Transcript_7352:249-878(-)